MKSAVSFKPGWSRLALTHTTLLASRVVSSRSGPGRGIVPCQSCSCFLTWWRLYRALCGLVDHDDSPEELAQVSHLLARWYMLDHFRIRRSSTTWLQWVAVVAPALWLTLLWAMQLRGGARRVGRAKRGARFFHPLVQLALDQGAGAGPRTRRALDEFLARQCLLVVAPPEEACMYVLASRLDIYVGTTATSRVTARTATSGAACRYWEHLVEIRKPAARGSSAEPSRKVACFQQCRAGHVAMLVVALGPRSRVASSEVIAIASGGCCGNAAGARAPPPQGTSRQDSRPAARAQTRWPPGRAESDCPLAVQSGRQAPPV